MPKATVDNVGMRLALAHPGAVRSLALLDTSAEEEVAERRPQYEAMAAAARASGAESVVDAVAPFMFSRGFCSRSRRGWRRSGSVSSPLSSRALNWRRRR